MLTNPNTTRAQWLESCREELTAKLLTNIPQAIDYPTLTTARLNVGYPATGTRHPMAAAGVGYYAPARSRDNSAQLFIAPSITDTLEAAAALLAGLVKAGCEHLPSDAPTRQALGLNDDYTPSDATLDILDGVLVDFPDYPDTGLIIPQHVAQKGRMIKFVCASCKWQAYTSRKQLELIDSDAPCPACWEVGSITIPDGKNS